MDAAQLTARLMSSESPAVWLAAAAACRIARRTSRHRSRWSSRLGYALERLDEAREARREAAADRHSLGSGAGRAAQHVRLARRLERRQDWAAAAAAYQAALREDGTNPAWWYRLGRTLRNSGDLPRAAEAARTACEQDASHPRWFDLLADCQQHNGELARALVARRRAVALGGAEDPRWRVKLADLHDRVGQWAEAQRALQENVQQHPKHPLSHRRLGEISSKLAYWGGSFTSTPAGTPAGGILAGSPPAGGIPGRFRFDQVPDEVATTARQALERAAELEPAKTTWRIALAEARVADGDLPRAIALYEAALRDAEQSTGRWVLAVKHRWQFALEALHHRQGQARVDDPLFECAIEPVEPQQQVWRPERFVGLFSARFTFAGLAITGLVADRERDDGVEVLLDGEPLRTVNVGGDGFFPQFSLDLKRPTLASFPRLAEIQVRTPDGAFLHTRRGADRVRLWVPHGSGQLRDIVAAGGKLDKKGVISPSQAETRLRQMRYLEIYASVRDFFDKELGRSLFLMYGTLLGYHREGDFIPGDDDFDAGYVSDQTDPVAVKEETKRLIVELVRGGFTVSFNRRGRLFRIQLDREATDGFHLDLRPVWFQDGKVWVHNHCSFPSQREDFLPVVEGELRGVRVLTPQNTEAFLRGHYGPGWRVPDPGFMYYTSGIDPAILDNLGKALITVREFKELAARIRKEVNGAVSAGRFVSVGSQDLYPLHEFLA